MAQAIIEAGYKRIGFLGTKMPLDHRARKRFEGFTETLAKAGLEIADSEFYTGGSALVKGREMTDAILTRNSKEPLDFLYYSNDMIGAGGLMHCLDKGIDVPGDIGLAGFNGIEFLEGLPRQLATMDACRLEVGRKAAEIIVNRVENPDDTEAKTITLEPSLDAGQTLTKQKRS